MSSKNQKFEECRQFSLNKLKKIKKNLFILKHEKLDQIYKNANDPRKINHIDIEELELDIL